jgi:hypothetical protein
MVGPIALNFPFRSASPNTFLMPTSRMHRRHDSGEALFTFPDYLRLQSPHCNATAPRRTGTLPSAAPHD